MANRLSRNGYRKLRYHFPDPPPSLLLLDFPSVLWHSFDVRAAELGITMTEFLKRETLIDQVIAAQLASLDPEIAVSGGKTSKPGPQRIECIFARLKA